MSHLNAKPLHCIFYSHPWTALLLKQIKNIDFTDSVLLELSCNSLLSRVLPNKPNKKYALTQVLTAPEPEKKGFFSFKKKDIFQLLAQKQPKMPAPVIFAPRTASSELHQISALIIALSQASVCKQVIVLIHYAEAQNFSSLYDYADTFHILWDIADLPCLKLTELTQLLATNHLNSERWGGFHLCNHTSRQVSDSEERYTYFDSLKNYYLIQAENV